MPSRPCGSPLCQNYVSGDRRFCDEHRAKAIEHLRQVQRRYDRKREPWRKAFYNSAAWKRARDKRLEAHPVCERCNRAWSRHVHHLIPLEKCTPEQRVSQEILQAVCIPCHNTAESELD